MPTSQQKVTRVAWVEYAFAIAIMLVVLGHVTSGIAKVPGLTMGEGLKTLNAFIYSFHMPLFFVISGYIVFLRKQVTTEAVIKDALWALAIPYLVWSVLWIAAKAMLHGFTDNPVSFSRVATILWEPVGHMWFLYHLLFIRLAWYGLERTASFAVRIVLLCAVAGGSTAMVKAGVTWVPVWHYLQNFAFFGFGLLVLPYLDMPQSRRGAIALALFAAALWGVNFVFIQGLNDPFTGLLLGMVGSLTVVLIAKALPEPRSMAMRLFAFIGEAALPIYVTHLFVTTAVRKALDAAGMMNEASVLVVCTSLGIALPVFAFWLILRSSHASGIALASYFGLGQKRNSRYLDTEAGSRSTPASQSGPALQGAAQQGA